MDEKTALLRAASNEKERDMDRFNAAATLAELGYMEEAVDAFTTIGQSSNVREKVRENANRAVQGVRHGEVPENMSEVPPAPIDSGPPPPPRPL